jgi:hypothetical protein
MPPEAQSTPAVAPVLPPLPPPRPPADATNAAMDSEDNDDSAQRPAWFEAPVSCGCLRKVEFNVALDQTDPWDGTRVLTAAPRHLDPIDPWGAEQPMRLSSTRTILSIDNSDPWTD